MKRNPILAKLFALVGTILTAGPIVFMFATGIVGSVMRKQLMMDYLIPAELFIAVLSGALLLLIAALMTHTCVKSIAWGFGIAVAAFVATMLYTMLSGLASGDIEPNGMAFVFALVGIIAYDLAVAELGVAGIVLCSKLLTKKRSIAQ
ncbi:MAG: hypothetical protein ACC608_05630 [Anaerofustis sp.]